MEYTITENRINGHSINLLKKDPINPIPPIMLQFDKLPLNNFVNQIIDGLDFTIVSGTLAFVKKDGKTVLLRTPEDKLIKLIIILLI